MEQKNRLSYKQERSDAPGIYNRLIDVKGRMEITS